MVPSVGAERAEVGAVAILVAQAVRPTLRPDVRASCHSEPRVEHRGDEIERGLEGDEVVASPCGSGARAARVCHLPHRVLLVEQVRIRTSHPLHDDKVPLLKVVHATRAQLCIHLVRDATVLRAITAPPRVPGAVRRGIGRSRALEPAHRAPAVVDVILVIVPVVCLHRHLDGVALVVLPECFLLPIPAPHEHRVGVVGPSLVVRARVELQAWGASDHHRLGERDEEIYFVPLLVAPLVYPQRGLRVRRGGRPGLGDERGGDVEVRIAAEGVYAPRRGGGKAQETHRVDNELLVVELRAVCAQDAGERKRVARAKGMRPDDDHSGVDAPHGPTLARQVADLRHVTILEVLIPAVGRV
mmetsp:Transcript_24343/g.60506  ORF Transcript_24343/g.60506 Transcript_24343/m.60506 type:complete len:357 (-) Transcript_24343:1550-2620(-)